MAVVDFTTRDTKTMRPRKHVTDRFRSLSPEMRRVVIGAAAIGLVTLLVIAANAVRSSSERQPSPAKRLEHQFLDECHLEIPRTFRDGPRRGYKPGDYCEGYWSNSGAAAGAAPTGNDEDGSSLPFPKGHDAPFCGQALFLKMLERVEQVAAAASHPNGQQSLFITRARGISHSRLGRAKLLGNVEFADAAVVDPRTGRSEQVCWTGDLRSHYIEKFNVRPSRRFVDYITHTYASLDSNSYV